MSNSYLELSLIFFLSLTIIMVNLKILKNSTKNSTLPPNLQNSLQHFSEFPDSSNLLSKTSFRVGK